MLLVANSSHLLNILHYDELSKVDFNLLLNSVENTLTSSTSNSQANRFKWFRMQRHNWSSTSQKEPMSNLSLSVGTGYRLQLALSSTHWCLHIEQPLAQHPPTSTHWSQSTSPPEVWDLLVSDASRYHHREAQNHFPEHSRSPLLAGGMTFPPPSGMLDPCQPSSNTWKLMSFDTTWLHLKFPPQKNNKKLSFSLFIPSFPSLYLFEQCLRCFITSTSSVCLPL